MININSLINFVLFQEDGHHNNYLDESSDIVIGICSKSGRIVEPWVDAGYVALIIDKGLDIPVNSMVCPKDGEPRIYKYRSDVEDIIWDSTMSHVTFVSIEAPCTHLSAAGARWWKEKDKNDPGLLDREAGRVKMLLDWAEKEATYVYCEQPRGRLPAWMKKNKGRRPDEWVQPYWYASLADDPESERYTKRTYIWRKGFHMSWLKDLPIMTPIMGDRTTKVSGRDKDARSLTPQGLSRAVFNACHMHSNHLGK